MSADQSIGSGSADLIKPAQSWNLFSTYRNIADANTGTSYKEPTTSLRVKIDFSKIPADQIRLNFTAIGDEAGNGKGIEIYDVTNTQQLCEKTWNGAANQVCEVTSWTSLPSNVVGSEVILTIRVKGSSVTEDMTVYTVVMQARRE